MVSRTTKTGAKAPAAAEQQQTGLAISPQIVALVLQELGAGAELATVAGKYGIAAEVIKTWQQPGGGGAAARLRNRSRSVWAWANEYVMGLGQAFLSATTILAPSARAAGYRECPGPY